MATGYFPVALTVIIGLFTMTVYLLVKIFRENNKLKIELDRMTQLRLEERKGRTNAEKLLRENPNKSINNNSNSNTNIVQHINLRVIGTFHSPYNNRRGTPRQGVLAPSAIGFIEWNSWLQTQSTLDGLVENFSHIWVIWQFHRNTNSIQRHLISNNNLSTNLGCKAKIKPPRLDGRKIGIFACRTPHRPNPVGLTKCKIIRMDFELNRLYLSDIDMIDGTPIIDIKPYIPYSDIQNDALTPKWCSNDLLLFEKIIWMKPINDLLQNSTYFKQYFDIDTDLKACKAIAMFEEILIRDIRSLYRRNYKHDDNQIFECNICDITIKYNICDANKIVTVVEAILNDTETSSTITA